MSWWIPVVTRIGTADIACAYFWKKATSFHSRSLCIFLMFVFSLVFSLGLVAARGDALFVPGILMPICMGLVNGGAVYFAWKAVAINLSKNSLFTVWDDVIAILLAMVILGETRFLNTGISIGILLSFLALSVFIARSYQRAKRKEEMKNKGDHTPPVFFLYVGAYSVIWGTTLFLTRYLALNETVAQGTFVTGWYTGALMTAGVLRLARVGEQKSPGPKERFKRHDLFMLLGLSFFVMASQALMFACYAAAPATVVQPIFFVTEMVVRSLVGLIIFKEARGYDWLDWSLFAVAVAGGLMIAFNFSS